MAKGNLFLGYARGSIGDVVMYRADNKQISRARNRRPANPKTAKQTYQRAIISTVAQAYSAGKAIFDHAFEGSSVGMANQRRFMSLNARELREQLAAQLVGGTDPQEGVIFVGPRATHPVAGPYIISRGTLENRVFSVTGTDGERVGAIRLPMALSQTETIAEYATRLGMAPGDIFTFVFFARPGNSAPSEFVPTAHQFGFVRLEVPEDIYDRSAAVSVSNVAQIFEVNETFNVVPRSSALLNDVLAFSSSEGDYSWPLQEALFVGGGLFVVASIGCIYSRKNTNLRSNSQMVWAEATHGDYDASSVLDAWSRDSSIGIQSDLILEGGGF